MAALHIWHDDEKPFYEDKKWEIKTSWQPNASGMSFCSRKSRRAAIFVQFPIQMIWIEFNLQEKKSICYSQLSSKCYFSRLAWQYKAAAARLVRSPCVAAKLNLSIRTILKLSIFICIQYLIKQFTGWWSLVLFLNFELIRDSKLISKHCAPPE